MKQFLKTFSCQKFPIVDLFIKCDFSDSFWQDLINWCNMIGIKVEMLTDADKIFGIWNRRTDFLQISSDLEQPTTTKIPYN